MAQQLVRSDFDHFLQCLIHELQQAQSLSAVPFRFCTLKRFTDFRFCSILQSLGLMAILNSDVAEWSVTFTRSRVGAISVTGPNSASVFDWIERRIQIPQSLPSRFRHALPDVFLPAFEACAVFKR